MQVIHPLQPIYDENSKILILGTMPSLVSREKNFYYAHPKNRFWKTLSQVYDEEIGFTNEERIQFLKKHHIALFDCLKSCDIESSSDASIKNPIPNDIRPILKGSKIHSIYTTGTKAHQLYQKYLKPMTNIEDIPLPSTSPAHCKKGIEDYLIKQYTILKKDTENKL